MFLYVQNFLLTFDLLLNHQPTPAMTTALTAAQLTLDAAAEAKRLAGFMQQYPIEWMGRTKLTAMPHTDSKVQYEAVIVGGGMQSMYDLSEAVYGELATTYGPVARAKEIPSSRYYTILTRRTSRVGRRKATVGEWGYMGIEATLEDALANLPYTRAGQYLQTA